MTATTGRVRNPQPLTLSDQNVRNERFTLATPHRWGINSAGVRRESAHAVMILGGIVHDFLVGAGVIMTSIYVLSLMLHPYTRCEACRRRGENRESGAMFSYAFRPCWRCRGRGSKQRFGARMLGIGEPRTPRANGKFAPASKHFPKPTRSRIFGIF